MQHKNLLLQIISVQIVRINAASEKLKQCKWAQLFSEFAENQNSRYKPIILVLAQILSRQKFLGFF